MDLPADQLAWHVDRSAWTIDGERYDQTNHYFLVRTPDRAPAVRPTELTDYEQTVMLGTRWWTLQQLRTTTETVWPSGLAELLAAGAG